MAQHLVLEQTEEGDAVIVQPNFLYRIIVEKIVESSEEVYVFGVTVFISAAGDMVIQNANGQRVFGVAAGFWYGLFIVDQETWKPVNELFPAE